MNNHRTIACIWMVILVFVGIAGAQDSKKGSQLRTVRGIVIDKAETPLPNSVVFLKNLRTNAVRSSFADSDGNYRFSGLDPNVDYEVHAELEGAKSPVKTVSSFDSRKEITLNLKIEQKKS
ncbi:MAG TPA: carboxypeptidase-like regulatory domain-containing protein [Candidatus Acidoferrum sp.]|nr:carboxypeptidase-like regulatory domain-containing protein [Candidatus Acidoferrum sp.]